MSNDVNLHLWLETQEHAPAPGFIEQALQCIPLPRHRDDDGRPLKRFERISVYDTSFSQLVLDRKIGTNDVLEVVRHLEPFAGTKFHYEISSAFDCLLYDDTQRSLEETVHPLTINFYGSNYGWQGLECKSYGPVRLDFSNTKTFQVPQALLEQIRAIADQRGDTTRWLSMPPRINRNFQVVSDLAKRLVLALNPIHLLICSDLEVHPLTSHALYHRDVEDYLKDLWRIAILHEQGGVYFCDVAPDEPAFIPARKSPPNYGYLRDRYAAGTEELFVRLLQPMVKTILDNPESLHRASDAVTCCFESLVSTKVEKLRGSYYLSVRDAPFAYLEEPFFKLYETLYNPNC